MTPIADMVKAMLDSGTPKETVVLAVRTIEMSQFVPDMSRDKREYERERKRNWRNKISTKPEANDAGVVAACPEIVPDNGDKRCELSSFLPSSTSLLVESSLQEGSKEVRTEVVDTAKKVSRGTRLTAETKISDADLKFAIDHGLRLYEIDSAWSEFIDYWIAIPGQRGTKLNWSATWRNRVRNITTKSGGLNGARRPGHRGPENYIP